jgi:hypothetical protein
MTDPSEVAALTNRPLTHGDAQVLAQAVGMYARVFDLAVVQMALTSSDGAVSLARNPAFSDEERNRLLRLLGRKVVKMLTAEYARRLHWHLPMNSDEYMQLDRAVVTGMVGAASPVVGDLWKSLQKEAPELQKLGRLPAGQLRLLLQVPDLPREILLEMAANVAYRSGGGDSLLGGWAQREARAIAHHPRADSEVWVTLLRQRIPDSSRAAIFQDHTPALKDEAVAGWMLQIVQRGGSPKILPQLLRSAPDPVWPDVWRLQRDQDIRAAAVALRRASRARQRLLQPDDLLPLLSSPDADCREAAIALLGRVSAPTPGAPTPDAAPPTPARARTR